MKNETNTTSELTLEDVQNVLSHDPELTIQDVQNVLSHDPEHADKVMELFSMLLGGRNDR